MKKILFIIQSYTSEKSANVLCDDKIMQELLKIGDYEIHCLSFLYNGQTEEEDVNGIHVHRWNRGFFWNIYTWAFHKNKGVLSGIILKLNKFFMRVKQIVFMPIYPFYEPLVAQMYSYHAKKLMQKLHFDMVIAEHNGLDTLYAGWKTKRKFKKVIFIPVFWDSLSGGFPAKYLPRYYVDRKKKKLEYEVVKDADRAIVMESHKKHIEKLWKDSLIYEKFVFMNIPYLKIQNQLLVDKRYFNTSYINIVFAGNMGMRDPSYLFKLVSKSLIGNINIHFFTDSKYHRKVQSVAQKNNILATMHDYVTHDELIAFLKEADILLNFGVNNPNAISGKIFEYIGFCKPIISTFFIDDEATLSILSKYDNALLIDERKDLKSNIPKFDKFITKSVSKVLDEGKIVRTYKNSMPESYVSLINDFFCENDESFDFINEK